MQKLDKIKEVTGKPEMPVGGQKRMLAEKKRNSKAY